MKLTKRLFTAGVALALTLSLNVPAFAADIKINNAAPGETYTAYKLFDMTSSGDNYSYYILNTQENQSLITLLDTTIGLDLVESADGSRYNVNMKDDTTFATDDKAGMTAAQLAAALNNNKSSLPKSTLTGKDDDEDGKVTISVAATGYYFVDSTLGSLCGLYTNEDEATINEKNSLPSIDKKVKEDSTNQFADSATIDVTDTIEYQLTVNTGTGYPGLGNGVDDNYVITDKLPTGITYTENSIAIKDWTTDDYAVSYDAPSNTLTITLKQAKLATLGQQAEIVITYKATAAGNLAVDTEHKNTVTLTYKGQNPTDNAVVKTYDIANDAQGTSITKKDEEGKALQGVKFVLSKSTSEGTKYAKVGTDGYLDAWVDEGQATELVTDAAGHINVKGLDADTYTLTETYTLPGYNLLADTITVDVAEDGSVTYKLTNSKDKAEDHIDIVNVAGSLLPSTGGMGTTVLYIAGVALALGAGITLVVRRRMNSDR